MRRSMITGIFFLSGAAGLIFEVVWSRQLVLVFGNTTQAVSAILTGFFGGMAIGSWYGGKIADRVRRPLLLYGLLELALVGVVMLTPITFGLIKEVYRSVFGALEATPSSLSLVRFALALVALAPATMLMGATLPTLTRSIASRASDLNEAFSALYVSNTMGAVFGAMAAGLVLIEILGLSGALMTGAACSGLAGLIAVGLALSTSGTEEFRPQLPPVTPADRLTTPAVAVFVSFVSGATSLGYQVVWMRLISSGTGSSTYVFSIILIFFLLGLAFGAVEYKRRRAKLTNIILILCLGQLLVALLAVSGMYVINKLDPLPTSFLWKALFIVLPPTFVMGFTFPATTALIGGSDSQVGARSGLVLTANTVGAIAATFLIPFVLIPLAGSPMSIALLAGANIVAAIVLAVRHEIPQQFRRKLVFGGAALGLAISVAVRSGRIFVDPGVARMNRSNALLYQSNEDQIASVQAGSFKGRKQLWVAGFSMTALTVDAKLMPILPLIYRPQAQSILVVAFGMGSAFRASLIAGLQTEAVELVPSVPKLFKYFYTDAESKTADRSGRIVIADGRNHMELTPERYDIIVVDPPPPLESAGVSVISSHEFYSASRGRLRPGGIMMQWVPRAQSLADFKNHVRTFRDVFPNVVVAVGPGGNGFYMLGSDWALEMNESLMRAVLARPGVIADLSSAYDSPTSSLDGWALLIPSLIRLRGGQVADFTGPGDLITDDRPLPEYFLLRRSSATGQTWMSAEDVRPK